MKTVAIAIAFVSMVSSQTFEASSVKHSQAARPSLMTGGPGSHDPGRIRGEGIAVRTVVYVAYGVRPFQVDGPRWLDEDLYDVEMTLPDGTRREDLQPMFRALLAARWGMRAHTDTREATVYILTAGTSPKLRAGTPGPSRGAPTEDGTVHMDMHSATMQQLADILSHRLDALVLDRTAMGGPYDAALRQFVDQVHGDKLLKDGPQVGAVVDGDGNKLGWWTIAK